MMEKFLTVKDLSFCYGKTEALHSLSFSAEKGEILGVAGANGSGKTTLIRCLLGLCPFRGTILIGNKDLQKERKEALRSLSGFCDDAFFLPQMTGRENLHYAAFLSGAGENAAAEAETISGLGAALDQKASFYSCGMKKRLQFAAAVTAPSSLLIFDEPLQGLDPDGILLVRELLSKEAKNGRTILFCDHSLREMESVCSRILFLNAGAVFSEWKKGDPDPPETFYRKMREEKQ